VYRTHGTQVGYAHPRAELVDVTFKVAVCALALDDGGLIDAQQTGGRLIPPTPHRKYRRTKKSFGPRTYRTRKDPFEAVWDEVRGWIEADPERTIKSVFLQLHDKCPGQYPDAQLRTLHRHVAIWRAGVILTFGDQWVATDALDGQILPLPLRVSSVPDPTAPTTEEQSA
jgi:hypothetical protein